MKELFRRIFGRKVVVTQEHINLAYDTQNSHHAIAAAVQSALDKKYGYVCAMKENGVINCESRQKAYAYYGIYVERKNYFGRYEYCLMKPYCKKIWDFVSRIEYDLSVEPFYFYCFV